MQAFGQFAQEDVPGRVFRIEDGHAFVAGERFDIAVLLQEKFGGDAILFDGFGRAVLFLQQRGVTHQPIRRLGIRAEKTSENGGGFGGVASLDQTVELDAVVLGAASAGSFNRVWISARACKDS